MARPRAAVILVALGLLGACSSSPTTDSSTSSPTAAPTTATSSVATTTTLEAIPVWVRAPVEPSAPANGSYEAMNAVVVSENRLVAVGTSRQHAAVWMSLDGLSWDRLLYSPDLAADSSSLGDVVVGGPGLVAVGSVGAEDGGSDAAVWTSRDGLRWSRIPHDAAVFGGTGNEGIKAVAAGSDGLVAVGYKHPYSEGAVWVSTDGLEWSRAPHNAELFGPPSFRSLEDVATFDGGFIAVGSVWSDGSPHAAVWQSPDGLSWSQTAVLDGGEMRGLTSENGTLIAVGWQKAGAAVWKSEDGLEWVQVGANRLRGSRSEMRAVLATDSGLIAVGSTPESGSSDGAVWRSPDGLLWSRDESAALGGRWSQDLFAVAEFAGGIAVIGADSSEFGGVTAAAWFIGPSTAVVPTTTTTLAPSPTIVIPAGAPEFLMRCGDLVLPYESPPPITYPECPWVTTTDPFWGVARWVLDPANPPDPSESVLHIRPTETGCGGGAVPEGREVRSVLMASGDEVVVFVLIEPSTFPMNCPGNPSLPMTIELGRPLGELRVFEGFFVPPLVRYPAP